MNNLEDYMAELARFFDDIEQEEACLMRLRTPEVVFVGGAGVASMDATLGSASNFRRPKTSEERKAEPIYSGVLRYFPDALAAIARVSKAGNDKHNPGEPLHWARGKSTDQMDCLVRHSLTPDEPDPETREPELAHAAWRVLAELQLLEEKRNREKGVRSYSGVA